MAQTYFALLTKVGEAKDANAKALGVPLRFTELAVGDGNGLLPVPDPNRTTLVNQVRRAPLNSLSIDQQNTNQVIAEQVIPENVGGWWIRELGLYDADGDLIAIANCPPTYKPQLAEGSGRTQVVRMVLIISSADSVQLKIDPAIVLATRKYSDDSITASMGAHMAAADPHPIYMTSTEGDAKIAIAVATLVNSSPLALDTLAELAAALGNDANFAATITNSLAGKERKFDAGTKALFVQSAAPTGWTKDTTHNDKALRIVSGAAGSGGALGFLGAFASRAMTGSVGATTLTIAQIPSHGHTPTSGDSGSGVYLGSGNGNNLNTTRTGIGSNGGGGSHTHSMGMDNLNMSVQYVDAIIATKDQQ